MAGKLFDHLFRDGDEHGAAILAEIADGPRGPRLLARNLTLAADGTDYVEGTVGYRRLTPRFVRDHVLQAKGSGLTYLAVHNHGGSDRVGFSKTDLASHERGYPALVKIARQPVGGLIFASQAAAGDLWLPDGHRAELAEVIVPGNNLRRLPPHPVKPEASDPSWDRQTRIFGDRGQLTLNRLRVGIVGTGGAGSIIVELLARLGVGNLVLVDPDKVDPTNLSRLIAAESGDVGLPKVELAARNARRANPEIRIEQHAAEIQASEPFQAISTCDWLFLAADSAAARHSVNKTVQEKLIPGTQVGVKVHITTTGDIGQIHAVSRLMIPGQGCLWCNQLIDPTELAIDLQPETDRRNARYLPDIPAPSVIALNSLAASEAVSHFMLSVTGLHTTHELVDVRHRPRARTRDLITPRRDKHCVWCGRTRTLAAVSHRQAVNRGGYDPT